MLGSLHTGSRLLQRRTDSEGETELKKVLELQPQKRQARIDLGAALSDQEQAKQAQEAIRESSSPRNRTTSTRIPGLAWRWRISENHAGAIDEYKTALKIDPKRSRRLLPTWAFRKLKLKQYDDAIASYLKERDSKRR